MGGGDHSIMGLCRAVADFLAAKIFGSVSLDARFFGIPSVAVSPWWHYGTVPGPMPLSHSGKPAW